MTEAAIDSLYIPIGNINVKFHDTIEPSRQADDAEPGWIRISSQVEGGSDPLVLAINRLIKARLIIAERYAGTSHVRLYGLPEDVARGRIKRGGHSAQLDWQIVLTNVVIQEERWNGARNSEEETSVQADKFQKFATADSHSLFYIFNSLPSPEPQPSLIRDPFARKAVKRLLDEQDLPRGLQTMPYPYQRRSAALMLQRESAPRRQLDPRLELRVGPKGQSYFYAPRSQHIFREPRYYETIRGGILAETMGVGKTLICIAVILSTLGQLPEIPPNIISNSKSFPEEVPSLAEVCASTIIEHPISWRSFFNDVTEETGLEYESCINLLKSKLPEYMVPPNAIHSARNARMARPSTRMLRSSGTLIVVPRNLLSQWTAELKKHVEEGYLKVLTLESTRNAIPSPETLAEYDIVLMSKSRLEMEVREKEDTFYISPFRHVHFLRLIVDEGHSLSSASTGAALAAERLITAERRWIVSGTPARDVMGVEVDAEALGDIQMAHSYREKTLSARKSFDWLHERSSGAVKSLGTLVSRFLKARPWALTDDRADPSASWEDNVYQHQDFKLRTYSSFSACFRRTLEGVIVRTRPQDIEKDLVLPALNHRIVRLQPSALDVFTANLFVLLFTSNAITSERSDQDYLFHKSSHAHLARLVSNLRQSTFTWVGFDRDSVTRTLDIAERYLARDDSGCSTNDRDLLTQTIDAAKLALESPLWNSLTELQEIGLALTDFPDHLWPAWCLSDCHVSAFLGLTPALHAQKYVNSRLDETEPLAMMNDLGTAIKFRRASQDLRASDRVQRRDPGTRRPGLERHVFRTERDMRLGVSGVNIVSPRRKRKLGDSIESIYPTTLTCSPSRQETTGPPLSEGEVLRMLLRKDSEVVVSPPNPLASTQIYGSTSAKLSYLVDRILELYNEEKILVFYEGNHVAYYVSQALDLLHVNYLIYANTLNGEQKSRYVVLFNTDAKQRVLLMDIRQAAHGLNISSASRVFFISPPCRPDVEAQAIKRAHRIGQTRPVFVETLVLEGTVEEQMFDRAAKMSRHEHLAAKSLVDDAGIRGIIQSARIIPWNSARLEASAVSKLNIAQQFFGRPERARARRPSSSLELEPLGTPGPEDMLGNDATV